MQMIAIAAPLAAARDGRLMNAALLKPFRSGDRAAIEEVYRGHVAAVERFVASRLVRAGRFSPTNLGDVVQEVFLQAFSPAARNSYDGEREYEPYLITIAKNVFLAWFRRSGRED